jgi:RND family efflux transporter MFP subunit
MRHFALMLTAGTLWVLGGCTPESGEAHGTAATPLRITGDAVTVLDTTLDAVIDAAGTAEPFARATLSTKIMGTVVAVLAREGDAVRKDQPLVRLDARELTARASHAAAAVAEADALHDAALAQARRIRGLYADSAATRAQLDAAETGLARAEAGVRAARAASAELAAVESYAVVRAPFAGTVTERHVDPGAFAAPGAPLITVQDGSRLRVAATAAPDAVRGVRRGTKLEATIEGERVQASVEGVVPAPGGNVYTINALVENPGGRLLPGSAASLALPQGQRQAVVVPERAVQREGELTGVYVRSNGSDALRWIRVGRAHDGMMEVLSGLRAGEQVVVPQSGAVSPAVDR